MLMKRFEDCIDIAATAERVWELTTDVESWPALFPTVTAVQRLDDGPMRVGSQARIKQPGQPMRVWTVTNTAAPRAFTWTARAKGFAMTATHEVTTTSSDRVTNRLILQLEGPLASLIAALAGRKLRRTLTIENEGFRRAATQADPSWSGQEDDQVH
jgi:carbon monoxide dehydrogenase subunit G